MDRKLSRRVRTSITIGRKIGEILPVDAGISQESPTSPTLFLLFNAPLIEECANSGLLVQVGGFVDDAHLIAYDIRTETNYNTLEAAHKICLKWARRHGASFATKNTNLFISRVAPKVQHGCQSELC